MRAFFKNGGVWALLMVFTIGFMARELIFSRAANAQGVSFNPKGTYGRMNLPDAGAVKVPAVCLSPRTTIGVYNLDVTQVCCGWDSNVTCSGTTGGWPVSPAVSGVPGTFSVQMNCDGKDAGALWCYSQNGTTPGVFANDAGFGWMETRG